MFRAKLEDPKLLKDSLKSISNLISEGMFKVTDEGLKLVAADPAMIALVDFKMEKDAFDDFEVEGEEEIGVNLEKMYSILKRAGSSDELTLSSKEDSKVVIKLENSSSRTFSLPLLNIDEENELSTQDLEFNAVADLKTDALSEGIGDAKIVSDSVTVEAESGKITIKAEGNNSNAEFQIEEGSEGLLDLNVDSPIKSMFSLGYLSKMMKADKLADTVKMKMGNDYPVRLEFQVPEKLELGFVLAPRLEEE